jgi:AraC-like DNA-binding protein
MHVQVNHTRTRTVIDFTNSGFNELVTLGKYNYNKAEHMLETHMHEAMIEICYSDKGTQWFAVGDQRYLVRGGDIFIHFPDELHGSGGHPEEKGGLYWFILKVPASKSKTPTPTAYLIKQLLQLKRRHFRGDNTIKKMLEDIFKVTKLKNEPAELLQVKINLLTQLFLLKVLELAKQKANKPDNDRLQKIFHLIENNLAEAISIQSLAQAANLSESRFKNWFKEMSGFTPLDYVQRKRVNHAVQRILAEPNVSFSDLAYELNLSSQQYFTTLVRKITGKTPSQIRQEALYATS